jgi:hypothetical protein
LLQQPKIAAFILAIACITPAATLADDAVMAMCMERDSELVCACASEALRTKIGDEDYAIYATIGEDYLARLEAGESRVDAWMEASRTEAANRGISAVTLMGRTNEIGNTHRAAIKECGG